MLIAPAAPLVIEQFPHILGYLHSLGAQAFYPVLPYADITIWAYYRILKENPKIKLITSACIGMNRYITKHHRGYAAYLCPVFSPLLCAARYLKTYRRMEEPLAFLSPCRLKKNEFTTETQEELVRYNITIDRLNAWLAAEAVDIRRYEARPLEAADCYARGLTLAAFGEIGKALAALVPNIRRHTEQGRANAASYLANNRDFLDSQSHAVIFEPYACMGGCANGSGVGTRRTCGTPSFLNYGETPDINAVFDLFAYYDQTLSLSDFCRRKEPRNA
ncbi:MAG: hypothetical protein LBE17_12340 [Treponema sp.]|jgi:iron only hydrogenase large subunit-like protein|nr:hypothetical protein [Treponema sp.]